MKLADENTKLARIVAGDGSELPARMQYADSERAGIHRHKAMLAKRFKPSNDWDGKADNDNAVNWPLARALVREGNTDLLKVAVEYRRIYDTAKSEAVLGGKSPVKSEGMRLVQRIHQLEDGNVEYKGARKSEAADADIPPKMKIPAGGLSSTNQVNVPRKWEGDKPVNDMIDAKSELSYLQYALGHLCEPLELAVIDGRKLEEVGNSVGVANRAGAMGAGRAVVHMGLITLRDAMRRKKLAA